MIPDPEYQGSGLHMTSKGGKLGIHSDFNKKIFMPQLYRRVNIFIYLNQDWDSDWGGK